MSETAPDGERLNRFLARRGVASRRAADEIIAAGRVRVDGRPATVGARVGSDSRVVVDGRPVLSAEPAHRTLALNKPPGVITTMRDPQGRPTVRGLVPDLPGLVPVGRLDADSRGLLLLTSDGELAHRIAHPRHGLSKVYRVTPERRFTRDQLAAILAGVVLDDGPARALAARRVPGSTAVELEMGEGRKRVVRRLVAAVGNGVADLCRVAIGPVQLGTLEEGAVRWVEGAELAALLGAVAQPAGTR